ncbi:MAG: hypothetical protein JNK87_05860 [Bryobacterales bacterium]|nr:hypothetical protein [Bryobacterales bacterium]
MGSRIVLSFLTLAAVVGIWDYHRGGARRLDRYDPRAVAGLETEMWRAYYEHRRMALFGQLVTLLRSQYGLSRTQSGVTALHAARAAARFQDAASPEEYQRALAPLRAFYGRVVPDRAERAALLELQWWIVHRERAVRGQQALVESLATLQAEIYGVPAVRFAEHARWRAEAMRLRDEHAAAPDWLAIGEALRQSWLEHWMSLAAGRGLLQPQNPRAIGKSVVVGGVPGAQEHAVL